MDIKPYKGKYSDVVRLLYEKGILSRLPRQEARNDLMYAEGIDIHFELQGMSPAKFKEYSEALLWAAYEEARRYEEEPIKFAKVDVALNRSEKGRKMISNPVREYTARGHSRSDVMVFGDEALGYQQTVSRGGKVVPAKWSLADKIDEILAITESYLKEFVRTQRPYKVIELIVSIRRRFPVKTREEEEEE